RRSVHARDPRRNAVSELLKACATSEMLVGILLIDESPRSHTVARDSGCRTSDKKRDGVLECGGNPPLFGVAGADQTHKSARALAQSKTLPRCQSLSARESAFAVRPALDLVCRRPFRNQWRSGLLSAFVIRFSAFLS